MKAEIRKQLEQKMAEQNDARGMFITPEQLQNILATAIAQASKMNPLEEEKYKEEQEKKRRRQLFKETIAAEMENQRRRMASCTHCRWPNSAGKRAGQAAPMGQGEWCTGGQVVGFDRICLVCVRCSHTWIYKATPQEIEYANGEGLLGAPPPDPSRLIAA